MRTWHVAVLKDDLFDLPKGTYVAVRQTKLVHHSINKTYWILSIKHKRLYHVADSCAGPECKYLLTLKTQVEDQERCEAKTRALKEGGQYAVSRRKEIRKLLKRKEK